MGLFGALAAAPPLLSSCSDSTARSAGPARSGKTGIALADVSRYVGGSGARSGAVSAVTAFTVDLYKQIASAQPGNVICSPYSVAAALAMTRNGARGRTATEMDSVLHAPDLQRLNEGMDSLALLIESRAGVEKRADGSKATVSMEVANSLWGQRGEAWEQPFLDALARYYGAGMRLVDYRRDVEGARLAINHWVSRQTHAKIPHLMPEDILDALTRLVLVNAIYLKAPWEMPFEKSKTKNRPFRLGDGRRISPRTMRDKLSVVVTEGSGWRAARLPYAGRQLAMTVLVPLSSLDDVERSMDARLLHSMLGSAAEPQSVTLTMPTWKFRLASSLNHALSALGMPTAFDPHQANFTGMTRQEQLVISAVQHEAYIAVDEEGTEAAAATAVAVTGLSAELPPPPFLVDRPFLFVIHDVQSAAPVFIGRVTDPSGV